MRDILKKAFIDHNYHITELENDILFSYIDNQEYFLTAEYTEKELEYFFDSDKTDGLIKQFENLQKNRGDIKKNTTLFVYVRTDNIKKFYENYRNYVFKIEEDEYFFRKHVIIYSKKGISKLKKESNISNEVQAILFEEDRITEFEKKYYEDEEFFIAVQLMAKLPFLVLKDQKEEYDPLIKKVQEQQAVSQVLEFIKWIEKEEKISYFQRLKAELLSEEVDILMFDSFVKQFWGNDDADK